MIIFASCYTLYNKEISMCEAGVGIGKTLAYLVACVLWQMNRPDRLKLPVVISTSSVALQDAIINDYLPNLSAILLEERIIQVPLTAVMEQKYGAEFWRPALFAMLTAVQQGRVNAIMVQSLDRLSHDITTLYRILRFLQNYGAVLITTETNLQYELYLTGLDARLLRRHNRKPIYYVECEER